MPPLPKEKLSVLVLTRNEEAHIEACLRSAEGLTEDVVVIDALSEDGTIERARRLGARVLTHPFKDYASQRNWALGETEAEWVFFLDADERLAPALRDEILHTLKGEPAAEGFLVPRINYFGRKRIRFGGWGGDRVLRLFRRTRGRYIAKSVHEELALQGRVASLRYPLHHYTFSDFARQCEKVQHYTSLGAEDAFRVGKRSNVLKLLLYPPHAFIKSYVLKGGFLEGAEGAAIAWLEAFSTFLKYAKLWQLGRGGKTPSDLTNAK